MLDVLEEVFRELDIDFYIIGAFAREYWYRRGDKRIRQTKDIDFAVLVPNKERYESVRERLREHRFADTRENAFVMISPEGVQVDLLPFGDIAIDDNVKLSGEGMTSIQVDGFIEVYNEGVTEIQMDTGHTFKAATLPAITLLKMIAYDDRPEKRQKDARDIACIIQHFFDLQADHIYEYHNNLFLEEDPERELQDIAATVIGREIKKMCLKNQILKNRLTSILSQHIEKGQASFFVQEMVAETGKTVKEMVKWLKNVYNGLES